MSQLKIPLILFCVVFVFSTVLALFSGSSWLGVIFKASVSALAVAGFALVARMLLVKYIPDMFEGAEGADSPETPIVGTNLDIRIEDKVSSDDISQEDEVNLGSPTFASGGENVVDQNNASTKEENVENSPFGGDALLDPPDSLGISKKEGGASSQDTFTPTSFTASKPSTNEPSPSDKKDVDQNNEELKKHDSPASNEGDIETNKDEKSITTLENVSNAQSDQKILDEELKESIEKDVDRLEELPDLQEFVDSSNLQGSDSKGDELMNTGTQSFFASDVGESVTDSKLMANAIRTVLKRES